MSLVSQVRCDISSERRKTDFHPSGFDYAFNAIEHEDNEVYLAYKEMFDLTVNQPNAGLRPLFSIWFPWLDVIWVSVVVTSSVRSR